MPYEFPAVIGTLIRQQMLSGDYATEEEVLLDALQALASRKADRMAVHEAITDMEAGDEGKPLRQVADEIRSTRGWLAK